LPHDRYQRQSILLLLSLSASSSAKALFAVIPWNIEI
jgi:hypothetical protein